MRGARARTVREEVEVSCARDGAAEHEVSCARTV